MALSATGGKLAMPTVGQEVPMEPHSAPSKTLTPDQARAEYFPEMGRAAFYAALRRKEIPSLRLGRKFFHPASRHREISGNLWRLD